MTLRPSTAPRMKRQTRIGRSRAGEGGEGGGRAYAARSRKRGSNPKLKSASPPDFTTTLRVTAICNLLHRLSPLSTALHRPIVFETPALRAPGPPPAPVPRRDRERPPPARGARPRCEIGRAHV